MVVVLGKSAGRYGKVAMPHPPWLSVGLDVREGSLARYRDRCQYTLAKFSSDTTMIRLLFFREIGGLGTNFIL